MSARRAYDHSKGYQVAYWLGALTTVPEAVDIQHKWGCSRATAYRFRAFAQANGTQPMPQRPAYGGSRPRT